MNRTGPVGGTRAPGSTVGRDEMAEIEADLRAERRLITQALLALAFVGALVAAALAAPP